ncbi:tRNA lysidine(34) synthetase TilS, partial [Streptomyces phyllanthi]|nr:tRNA lysidine(34) synthetase TilS [Streptomyces phyllanthi]
MGPHPAVAAIRLAVRRVLHDILTEQPSTIDETSRVLVGDGVSRAPATGGTPHSPT